MYAIIESGGKQYRVELGTELEVDRLPSEAGHQIVLDRVLLVADGDFAAVGRPVVEGAAVHADVVRKDRGEKIVVFKYKAKTRHRTKRGHRQELTVLRIADIVHDGRSAAKAAAAAEKETETEREAAQREAAAQVTRDQLLAAELAKKTTAAKAKAEAEAPAKSARGRAKTASAAAKAAAKAEAKPKAESEPKAEPTKAESKPKAGSAAKTKSTAKATAEKKPSAKASKASADNSAGRTENTKARRGRATKED